MTTILERETASAEETEAFAADIARQVTAPLVLLLDGDLGTGKTTFTRGFVGALEGSDGVLVQSPTFAFARTYATTPPVHHVDLYRLDAHVERALQELGVSEMLCDDNAFALVEWPRDIAVAGRVGRVTFIDVGQRRRVRVTLP